MNKIPHDMAKLDAAVRRAVDDLRKDEEVLLALLDEAFRAALAAMTPCPEQAQLRRYKAAYQAALQAAVGVAGATPWSVRLHRFGTSDN